MWTFDWAHVNMLSTLTTVFKHAAFKHAAHVDYLEYMRTAELRI